MLIDHLLFVCVGNICRSPAAEYLMRARIAHGMSQNREDVGTKRAMTIESAGLSAVVGHPADETIQNLVSERGVEMEAHRARQLDSSMVTRAGLVLVMEGWQREEVSRLVPSARGKTLTLGHWGEFDIDDPYRGSPQQYRQAIELIERGIEAWAERIVGR